MSRKKTALVLFFLVAFIIFLVWLFFFSKKPVAIPTVLPSEDGCVLYQSADATKPCFIENSGAVNSGETGNGDVVIDYTPTPVTTNTDKVLIQSCNNTDSEVSDACIKNIAVENKKVSLCGGIQNVLNKSDCVSSVGRTEKPVQEVFVKPVINTEAIVSKPITGTTTVNTLSSRFNAALNSLRNAVKNAQENPDSRYTAEGFFERLGSSGGLALYAFSEFQVQPGATVIAQGVGFTKTDNTLYVNGFGVPGLQSADGFTLEFTLPQGVPLGRQEVWVTNANGTSRLATRPVYITVTNNPVARPVITSVSPTTPTVNDRVTLTGSNLGSMVSILTSLGMTDKMQSTDTTVSFNISDLNAVSKIKDLDSVKGKLIPVQVVVGAPQGYNKDTFVFNVQF